MPGSKTNVMSRKETLAVVRGTPPSQDFVWDGVDADDRQATAEELHAGVAALQAVPPKSKWPSASTTTYPKPSVQQARAGKPA